MVRTWNRITIITHLGSDVKKKRLPRRWNTGEVTRKESVYVEIGWAR